MKQVVVIVRFLAMLLALIFIGYFSGPPAKAATTITKYIAAGGDDTQLTAPSTFVSTENILRLGKDQTNSMSESFRFTALAIPDNVTITSATIQFRTWDGSNGVTIKKIIKAEAVDSPVAPTSAAEFSSKASNLTTASTEWNFVATSTSGVDIVTSDFSSVIQEIVDRAGWSSGGDIQIFLQDNGTDNYGNQRVRSYEYGGISIPLLSITYEEAAPNNAPVAVDDTAETAYQTSVLIDATANDTDADSDALTITDVSAPTSGSAVIEGNQIRYAPDNGFSGEDFFTYDISDGRGGTDSGTVTVTVLPFVNTAPVAVDDTVQVYYEISRLIDVLSNDTDVDGQTLSITGVSTPTSGTAVIESGKIRYTPNSGFSGGDSFTYSISDGAGGADTATVTLTVLEYSEEQYIEVVFDKSSVPTLYYYDLTANVYVGSVASVAVQDTNNNAISSEYNSETGYVRFTTALNSVTLVVGGLTSTENIGDYNFETLKYGKSWAWSHGMDDNVNLVPQIEAFKAKGWRATLFLISDIIYEERLEGWIEDVPDIHQHMAAGWSIGNHGWHSECVSEDPEVLENDVLLGYNRLMEIVASSSVPSYKVISFAAPCFRSQYTPIIAAHKANGTTDVQFNESGSNYEGLLLTDDLSGALADYNNGAYGADALTYDSLISRNTSIQTNIADVMARMDWASANSNADRHIWFNSLTHGNNETNMIVALDHAYDNYGPGGTDELWMAPSDEIYSYLLVRDNTVATITLLESEVETPPVEATPTPAPPASTGHTATTNIAAPSCDTTVSQSQANIFEVNTQRNSATIYFSPVADLVSYYYIAFAETDDAEAHGASFDSGPAGGVLSVTLGELKSNTTYYVKVRPGNGCAAGQWSSIYEFKTASASPFRWLSNIFNPDQETPSDSIDQDNPQPEKTKAPAPKPENNSEIQTQSQPGFFSRLWSAVKAFFGR